MTNATLGHLVWLTPATASIRTIDGKEVKVFELKVDTSDKSALSAWAKYFREHYCKDADLDTLRDGTAHSRESYLIEEIFPSRTSKLGPIVRSGDFAEILVADILEDRYGFWVPRTRYSSKSVPDESPKGSDIIALRFKSKTGRWHADDILAIWESKAQMSGTKPKAKLQEAVSHSVKDFALRKSFSLNAAKRKLIEEQRLAEAGWIQRFQDPLNRPYIDRSGAAAVLCSSVYDVSEISRTDCALHPNRNKLDLIVVHSSTLMAFVHSFYELAANEA